MAAPRIIVVGGGLAGLAAVIKIAEAGGTVDLFSIVPVKRSHSVSVAKPIPDSGAGEESLRLRRPFNRPFRMRHAFQGELVGLGRLEVGQDSLRRPPRMISETWSSPSGQSTRRAAEKNMEAPGCFQHQRGRHSIEECIFSASAARKSDSIRRTSSKPFSFSLAIASMPGEGSMPVT